MGRGHQIGSRLRGARRKGLEKRACVHPSALRFLLYECNSLNELPSTDLDAMG